MKKDYKAGIPVVILITILLVSLGACHPHFTPKPRGYFRIDLPKKNYSLYQATCPFSFEYPAYSEVVKDPDAHAEPCWLNININSLNARIHLSYKPVNKNLGELIEDSRTLAYKHTAKADAINETVIVRPKDKVYCVLYDIKGNAASSVQFFATDSTSHFIRGALYFETSPNADSLAPLIDFIRQDIVNLINTLKWNNSPLPR